MALASVVSTTRVPILDAAQVNALLRSTQSAPNSRVNSPPRQSVRGTMRFRMQHQQQSNWCWAALASSVSVYYDASSPWTQGQLADKMLQQTTCCVDGGSAACDQPSCADRALSAIGNLADTKNGAATFDHVREEVDAKRPMGCRIRWTGGGDHAVAIYGYDAAAHPPRVFVADPLFGTMHCTYDHFSSAYKGKGSWQHTYLTRP